MRILVTDPEQRAALAAARALGRGGFEVYTIGGERGLAGVSKYVAEHQSLPLNQLANSDAFRDSVGALVRRVQADAVVPVTDRASRALLGFDQEIGAVVAGPSRHAYLAASDKASLLATAQQCGLRVPQQQLLEAPGSALAPELVNGWVVVKPAHSVVEVDGAMVSTTVRYALGREALTRLVATYPAQAYPLMLQERIVGYGEGVFLLRKQQQTQLVFAHRRLREKPPAGGVSTYREAIQPPAALVTQCEALLDALGYEGAAMIEFKRDAVTGEHVLMEINARLWGSVQLAVDAGVNFPLALVQSALGQPFTGHNSAKVGVRSVWELGELDHMWALLRRSPEQLQLPPGEKSGVPAVFKALFNRRLGDHPEVFCLSDPMPFFAEFSRWIRAR